MAENKGSTGRKGNAGTGAKSGASGKSGADKTDPKQAGSASRGTSKGTSTSSSASKKSGSSKTSAASGSSAKTTKSTDTPKAADTPKTSPDTSPTSVPASGGKTAESTGTADKSAAIGSSGSSATTSTGAKAEPAKPSGAPPAGTTSSGAESADKKPSETKPEEAKPAGAKPSVSTSSPTGPTSAPNQAPTRQAAPTPRRGGFFPIFLGGICAAAIGFGAAWYLFAELGLGAPDRSAADATEEQLLDQSGRIDKLETRVDAIPAAPDTSGLESGQADMQARIAELSDRMSKMQDRLDALEAQPTGADGSGVSKGQLNDLRETVTTQAERLEALEAEAEDRDNAARAAAQEELRRAALTRIRTALDTGSPFADALGNLKAAGLTAPDALRDVAEAGVPTQTALQASFAPAARAALDKAREAGEAQGDGGFWSFMSDQLGARSLEPQEGPGTDATLSRAEADLREGDLEAALSEVKTLSDPARAQLSDWAEDARARMQALAAHDALAAKLN